MRQSWRIVVAATSMGWRSASGTRPARFLVPEQKMVRLSSRVPNSTLASRLAWKIPRTRSMYAPSSSCTNASSGPAPIIQTKGKSVEQHFQSFPICVWKERT